MAAIRKKAECCRGIAVRGEAFAVCLPRSCADQFEKLQRHERVSHSAGLAVGV